MNRRQTSNKNLVSPGRQKLLLYSGEYKDFDQLCTMSKKPVLFILVIIIVAAGCGGNARNSESKTSYTVATLKGPSSMAMIRLIDSINSTADPGIRIDILDEPTQVRKMVLDGSADFAILPTTTAAIIYNKDVDYKLIAIPVWGTLYLLGSDTAITGWEDLRNKTVNVMGRGITPDIMFRHLLQKNGIDPEKEITLDYRFPSHIDLANAVASGQAKLGVVSEPQVSLVLSKNKDLRPILDLNLEWSKQQEIPIAQTAFLCSGGMIKENVGIVEQLISAYERSTLWVNEHPDSAALLIVKYGILPDYEVALGSIPRSNLNFVRADTIQSQIKEYFEIFYTMNPDIIGGKIPDENFFYK